MAWKKIGAAWESERGGISISLSQGETLEYGVKAWLFPAREKKTDKSPDFNVCIRTDHEEERPRKSAPQEKNWEEEERQANSIPDNEIPF